jgi:hypothetical protein
MDKYFKALYMTLAYICCVVAPSIPMTALIENAKFESWDPILELIKWWCPSKAERKWLEQFSFIEKSGKDKEDKSNVVGLGVTGTLVASGWSVGVMG